MSVVELTSRYRLGADDLSATLTLTGTINLTIPVEAKEADDDENLPICLTLLHERMVSQVESYVFTESFTLPLNVCMSETLTIIARQHGHIIGSLVNEVDTSETSRVLLHPKGGYNVIVYQEREPAPEIMCEEIASILASIQL